MNQTALNLTREEKTNVFAGRKFFFKDLFSFLFALCLCSQPVFSQWATNPAVNNPICLADVQQVNQKIIPDGAGGAIIAWIDQRGGSGELSIYAQRISASGYIQWPANGIVITSVPAGMPYDPQMVSDGSGGAIIV